MSALAYTQLRLDSTIDQLEQIVVRAERKAYPAKTDVNFWECQECENVYANKSYCPNCLSIIRKELTAAQVAAK